MKNRENAKEIAASLLRSGGFSGPVLLFHDEMMLNVPGWVIMAVDASTQFRFENGLLRNGSGASVRAVAFWRAGFRFNVPRGEVRICLLVVQRNDGRYYFGIPVKSCHKLKELPGMDYTDKEVQLLISVANTVSGDNQTYEETVGIDLTPIANTIASNQAYWLESNLDHDALYAAFTHTALNLDIIAATVDAQLPVLGDVTGIPRSITAFVTVSSDDTGREYVRSVAGAATFSNEPGRFSSGVIELRASNLEAYDRYPGRVTIQPLTKGCSTSILNEAAQKEGTQMAGGPVQDILPENPLILTTEPLRSQMVLNIEVPDGLEPPDGQTLDLFRTAASHLVQPETLLHCRNQWMQRMHQPEAYRLNGFYEWRKILRQHICTKLFPDPNCGVKVRNLLEQGVGTLESANQERISEIIEYYRHSFNWKKLPLKKDISTDTNRTCFQHHFDRGKNRGKTVIGFISEEAVVTALEDAGLTTGLLPALLREMRAQKLLLTDKDERDTLKFDIGGKKADCYTFVAPCS